MRSICRTTRWLITAGLIISLSLAGVLPPMVPRAVADKPDVVAQEPTKCCCGTEDGRCCGMGCCAVRQAPPKNSCPCPNPEESRRGQNNWPALATAKALFAAGSENPGLRVGYWDSAANRSHAETSLQARYVRIDA